MMATHIRDLPPGTRFVLCRTGQKFTYIGHTVSPPSFLVAHVVRREYGDCGLTTLHHSCHVKPIISAMKHFP